jgi:hypothetical protein
MSRESFVNREECATSPWGGSPRAGQEPASSAMAALRADAPKGEAFAQGHAAVGDLKVAL